MSWIRRSVLLVVVGLLLLGGVSSAKVYANTEAIKAQQSITTKAKAADPILPKADEARREDQGCPKGQDERQSDLCAQWKAADAAYDSAQWAKVQTTIGWIGLALGTVTMLAAIAAAMYAKRAAIATEDAVEIADVTSNRQLRAYVSVALKRLIIDDKNGIIDGEITITNGGSTPAYEIHHAGNICVLSDEEAEREFKEPVQRPVHGTPYVAMLPSGQSSRGQLLNHKIIGIEDFLRIKADAAKLYVFGYVSYADVLGHAHYTRFCYVSEPGWLDGSKDDEAGPSRPGPDWALAPFHNEAS